MLRLSYWVFPIISGLVWLGMLLGLLLYWIIDTKYQHYSSMTDGQNIAYISDIGASKLQPLFITGCVVTTVFLDLSFLSDRWLRHRGRLVPNTTIGEKVLSGLTIVFAIIGTAGLILLSIFDTVRHPRLHDVFLLLFIAGYILSAIFICWEYQRLGIRYREHSVLRNSFWIKLFFVITAIVLAIAFAICTFRGLTNAGAILEWAVAVVFTFYVFSFYIDLYPAVRTRNNSGLRHKGPGRFPQYGENRSGREMEEAAVGSDRHLVSQGEAVQQVGYGHHGGVPSGHIVGTRGVLE